MFGMTTPSFGVGRATFILTTILAAWALAASGPSALGQEESEPRIWQGKWNNRRFGTSGPLRCTAAPKDKDTWEAKFEGMFMQRRFNYEVTFAAEKKGTRTLLQGDAKIDGDTYRWQGYVRGRVLYGRFRSAQGNNGSFSLQLQRR